MTVAFARAANWPTACSAIAFGMALVAAPAFAQAPAPTAAADGEIVVTAQRVTQNLQDVPLAVTAVGAAELARQNVTDATRLESIAPGLTLGRSGTDLRPAIRGARTENIGANADPTVGFFVDGVYQSRTSQALAAFVDLERVEVLRGPQGTLFGRNTYGGAISLISAKPTKEFGAGLDLLYARYNRVRASGFVNAPLSEDLQVRVAAAYERADGYVKNISTGGDLGKDNQFYIRPTVRYASGPVELIVRGTYWKETGNSVGAFGFKSRGALIDASVLSPTNRGGSLGGNALPYFNINPRLRDGVADINGFDIGLPIPSDIYTVAFDSPSPLTNELYQANADLSIDLGGATIRSITGYSDWYSFRAVDNDFSPIPFATDYNITRAKTFSEELQLIGKRGGSFEWILGGFYYNDKIYEIFFNDQNNAFPAAGSAAAVGPPFAAGTPSGLAIDPNRADSLTPVTVNTESLAGFGQATYRFSDQFSVTGGIRYTSDKKRYSRQLISAPNLTLANAAAAPFTQQDQRATFERVTWKAGVEFKPSERSLIYAQVSTGFTSGGFNGGTFNDVSTTPPTVRPLPAFAPQTITAYEIGTKNRFADGAVQINASFFYNDLKNLQVQSQVPFGGTVLSITGNAGQARSYGAEVEAILRPTRNLTVGINATYLNAKYSTLLLNNPFPNPIQACTSAANVGSAIPLRVGRLVCLNPSGGTVFVNQVDLAGAKIPYASDVTVQAYLNWDIDTSFGTVTPSVNTLFNSGYFLTDFNTLLDKQTAFTKTDLRLSWQSLDKKFTLQAFVENVENSAVNQRGAFGTNQSLNAHYAMPRTYGIKGGVRF